MTNILYINTSDCVGGAAKVCWNLGHNLTKAFKASYITYEKRSTDTSVYKIPNDILLYVLRNIFGENWTNLIRYYRSFILSNDIDFGYSWKDLSTNHHYQSCDIVHLHNLHGSYFKLDTLIHINKPIVWTLHDEWAIMPHGAWSDHYDPSDHYFKRNNLMSYPPMLFNNETLLKKKKTQIYSQIKPVIVSPSIWLKNKLLRSLFANHDIHTIPNGIDKNIFRPLNKNELRHKYGLPMTKKIILTLSSGGNKNPQKGWEHAQKIIQGINSNDYLFLSVGSDIREAYYDHNIYYLPYLKNDRQVAECYSLSDLFLFTSNHENFPLTILESMGCGLPVVAFNVGGVSEQIKNGKDGFVSQFGDYQDMIKNITWYFNQKITLQSDISKEARNAVLQKFTLDRMVRSYQQLYQKLIK